MSLPVRLRLQRLSTHAILRSFEPNQFDIMELSLHRFDRALRTDQSQILQTLMSYSWHRRMADSTSDGDEFGWLVEKSRINSSCDSP